MTQEQSGQSRPRWWNGIVAALLILLCFRTADCEDIVHISFGTARAVTKVSGEVIDYTGKELVIRTSAGEKTFASDRVSHIETKKCGEHTVADRLFGEKKFSQAYDKYVQALDSGQERRRWVRREIMSQVVWCLVNLRRLDAAGGYFLLLVADDSQTPYFDCIPLAWTSYLTPALQDRAQAWLASENPVAALLGASHLLGSSTHRRAVLAKLGTMRFHTDPRIAALARAQSWRAEVATVTDAGLKEWLTHLEKFPEPLRAGAYYMLGTAHARRVQPQAAALALLRVPILYPRQRHLSARCLLDAGIQLQKIGQVTEAKRLYREVVEEYGDSLDAKEAQRRVGG